MAASGETDRPKWNPYVDWRGERNYHAKPFVMADSRRQWYHLDADGKVLGHLANQIVKLLMGKESPLYADGSDIGAFVVVTNCEKIRVSGKKYHFKLYMRNLSKRPGHLKVERFKDVLERFPERILMKAVWGMMSKTAKNKRIFQERLKLFAGPNHNYYQQDPVEFPMHLVKDCTQATNVKKNRRLVKLQTTDYPKLLERQQRKEAKESAELLGKYKAHLLEYAETLSEEELANLDLEQLDKDAQSARVKKVLEANEGKPLPKKKKPMYAGTNIQKRKIQANWR